MNKEEKTHTCPYTLTQQENVQTLSDEKTLNPKSIHLKH
jgi:hypothetical protein